MFSPTPLARASTAAARPAVVVATLLAVWLLALVLPELFKDRIEPLDSALFASSGALFSTLYAELSSFLRGPSSWLWDYYYQYPALAFRRHPPLFGAVEGLVYTIMGISVFSARLTILLFSVSFTVAAYFLFRKLLGSRLTAVLVTAMVTTSPGVVHLMRTVRLDIPALSFAFWSLFFYSDRIQGGTSSAGKDWAGGIFLVLALYTYQLPVIFLIALSVHLLLNQGRRTLTDRTFLLSSSACAFLLIPLALFTFYVAGDNLRSVAGVVSDKWVQFAPETNKLSLGYWTYYLESLVSKHPVQAFGLGCWIATARKRRLGDGEKFALLCLLVTYALFSWIPSKGYRYSLYLLPAVAPLAVLGYDRVLSLTGKAARPWKPALLACIVTPTLLIQFYLNEKPPAYLSRLGEPVETILSSPSQPRMFYSGPHDAAFVFYVRKADADRRARVARASVQLEDPDGLAAFLDDNCVDFIVLENRQPEFRRLLPIYEEFRTAIKDFIERDGGFRLVRSYELPYGPDGKESILELQVYTRAGPTSPSSALEGDAPD